jgi:hypothetical protein
MEFKPGDPGLEYGDDDEALFETPFRNELIREVTCV